MIPLIPRLAFGQFPIMGLVGGDHRDYRARPRRDGDGIHQLGSYRRQARERSNPAVDAAFEKGVNRPRRVVENRDNEVVRTGEPDERDLPSPL